MSSGKTETLGLNRWQLSDAFLMEEMNADNQKIDAGFKDLNVRKMELVDLKQIKTTMGGVTQIDVDVSDIDFTKYQYVFLDVNVTQASYVRVNGSNYSCAYTGMGYSSPSSGQIAYVSANSPYRLVFLTHGGPNPVTLLTVGSGSFTFGFSYMFSFAALNTLNFVSTDTANKFTAGSTFRFRGVRA